MSEETHLMVSQVFSANPVRLKGPGSVTRAVMLALPENAKATTAQLLPRWFGGAPDRHIGWSSGVTSGSTCKSNNRTAVSRKF